MKTSTKIVARKITENTRVAHLGVYSAPFMNGRDKIYVEAGEGETLSSSQLPQRDYKSFGYNLSFGRLGIIGKNVEFIVLHPGLKKTKGSKPIEDRRILGQIARGISEYHNDYRFGVRVDPDRQLILGEFKDE